MNDCRIKRQGCAQVTCAQLFNHGKMKIGKMVYEMYEKYDLVVFKLYQKEYYTFWYTDDKDGFLLDEGGSIKSFPTLDEAVAFSEEKGFAFDTEGYLLISSAVLTNINIRKIKCNLFLNYWNTFQDVAYSINCPFLGDERERYVIQHIYEKLFYGCNILLEEGLEPYRPVWSKKERRWIAKVMRNGFAIAAKGLRYQQEQRDSV